MYKYHFSYRITENDTSKSDDIDKIRDSFREYFIALPTTTYTVDTTFYISCALDINAMGKDIYKTFINLCKNANILGSCDIEIDLCEVNIIQHPILIKADQIYPVKV